MKTVKVRDLTKNMVVIGHDKDYVVNTVVNENIPGLTIFKITFKCNSVLVLPGYSELNIKD